MIKRTLRIQAAIITVFFTLSSCSKENIPENLVPEDPYIPFLEKIWTDPRIDYGRAAQLAQNARSFFEPGRTATKVSDVEIYPSEPIMSSLQTKSGADTLMYVFNYADGGYTIISTDARIGDVIAYVEKGSFNIRDTVNDELSAFLVGMMINYCENTMDDLFVDEPNIVQYAGNAGMPGAPGNKATWAGKRYIGGNCTAAERKLPRSPDDLVVTPAPPQAETGGDDYYRRNGCIMEMTESRTVIAEQGPFLKTEWHQDKPYNNEAPTENGSKCASGCVAIALAQIMAYHAHPTFIPYGGNFAGEPTYLSTHRKYAQLKTTVGPPPFYESLPKFIRRVGDELNNKWGVDESTANSGNFWELEWGNAFGRPYVIKCLETFGFTSPDKFANYGFPGVERSLNGGCPVYIAGYSDQARTKGHGWVIDGYKYQHVNQKSYYYYFDAKGDFNSKRMVQEFSPYEYKYVHCNFGWDQSVSTSNGYYMDGIFDTNDGPAVKGEDYNYKYRVRILINIRKK